MEQSKNGKLLPLAGDRPMIENVAVKLPAGSPSAELAKTEAGYGRLRIEAELRGPGKVFVFEMLDEKTGKKITRPSLDVPAESCADGTQFVVRQSLPPGSTAENTVSPYKRGQMVTVFANMPRNKRGQPTIYAEGIES